jgi:Leucine-rich repeat (LRR) protein
MQSDKIDSVYMYTNMQQQARDDDNPAESAFSSTHARTSVDLSGRPDIRDLSEQDAFRLSRVCVLKLSSCSFTEIPPAFSRLRACQELYLDHNKLRFVCLDPILEMRALRILDVSHNAIRHITFTTQVHTDEIMGTTHPLIELRLSFNRGLYTFADGLFLFPSLRQLEVAGIGLRILPVDVGVSCPTVQKLDMSWNQTRPRLDHLSRIADLRVLCLDNCQLSELPRTAPSCLEELYMAQNQISIIPGWVYTQFPHLKVLDLSRNRIARIDPAIDLLVELQSLRLASNYLRSGGLPIGIGFLKSLEDLDLSDNRLTHLPFPVGGLARSLKVLRLGDNDILHMPPLMGDLAALEELDLRSNSISELPHSIRCLTKLHTLDLRRNLMTRVPDGISLLPSLANLYLDCNLLSDIPDLSAVPLVRLTLNNNWITELPPGRIREGCLVSNQLDIPSEVLSDKLFLSSMLAAENKHVLTEMGITHILTVARGIPPRYPGSFTYMLVEEDDTPTTMLKDRFEACFSFIDLAMTMPGAKCLVHCARGQSRSPTIVAAYLMKKYKLGVEAALARLRQVRPQVHPNRGFLSQLQIYERSLVQQRR